MEVTSDMCLSVLGERNLLPADRHAVYLAGSLVRGWGNAGSDLDVYVITSDQWRGDQTETTAVSVTPATVPVKAFYVGDRRWDVEYWTAGQVDELIDRFSWDAFNAGDRASKPCSFAETAFIHRLRFSQPVEGEDWITRSRRQFSDSAVRTIMAEFALHELDHCTEDAAGMLANHDVHSAVLAARLALGAAVDAFLAINGEFEASPKWRARRLQAVGSPQLTFEEYWAAETMQSYDDAAPEKWVDEILQICQRVALVIEL